MNLCLVKHFMLIWPTCWEINLRRINSLLVKSIRFKINIILIYLFYKGLWYEKMPHSVTDCSTVCNKANLTIANACNQIVFNKPNLHTPNLKKIFVLCSSLLIHLYNPLKAQQNSIFQIYDSRTLWSKYINSRRKKSCFTISPVAPLVVKLTNEIYQTEALFEIIRISNL